MIILGKDEQLKFETDRENYSKEAQKIYDGAQMYHDGKWIMFEPVILLCLRILLDYLELRESQTDSKGTLESYI